MKPQQPPPPQQQAQHQHNNTQPQQTTVLPEGTMQQAAGPFQQPPQPVYAPQMYRTPKFRRVRVRHTMFKAGLGLLAFAAVLFIVGYSAPAWYETNGLWMSCEWGGCDRNTNEGPYWMDGVRVMETFCLILLLAAFAVELYQDFFKFPPPADNKAVEILAFIASGFGLIGLIVFLAKVPGMTHYHYDVHSGQQLLSDRIQWGFVLAAAGIILVLVSAILIAVSRVQHAWLTAQAMAAAGVYCPVRQTSAPPVMVPMQPMQPMPAMQPMQPMQMAPGYYNPYMAYPYAYPYLPPAATPMATLQAMPTLQGVSTSQGVPPTSQVPAFYVMTQGQMVPVYNEMPATGAGVTAASSGQQHAEASAQAQDGPAADGDDVMLII